MVKHKYNPCFNLPQQLLRAYEIMHLNWSPNQSLNSKPHETLVKGSTKKQARTDQGFRLILNMEMRSTPTLFIGMRTSPQKPSKTLVNTQAKQWNVTRSNSQVQGSRGLGQVTSRVQGDKQGLGLVSSQFQVRDSRFLTRVFF